MSETIKTPITKNQFDDICNQISTTAHSISNICKSMGISKQSFYDYKKIIGEQAEDQYARCKIAQIDVIQDKIEELQEQCLIELRTIEDPKRCNSIQSAYREQIRHYEWLSARLKAEKYGDKVSIDMHDTTVHRTITLPAKVLDGQKVSIYPESSETNNNEKISH